MNLIKPVTESSRNWKFEVHGRADAHFMYPSTDIYDKVQVTRMITETLCAHWYRWPYVQTEKLRLVRISKQLRLSLAFATAARTRHVHVISACHLRLRVFERRVVVHTRVPPPRIETRGPRASPAVTCAFFRLPTHAVRLRPDTHYFLFIRVPSG